MKALERELVEERKERRRAEKHRLLEKKKRQARNELKNAQYQVISNQATLKRMSKKQAKRLKKLQMNEETGVIEIVDAWGRASDPSKNNKRKEKEKVKRLLQKKKKGKRRYK